MVETIAIQSFFYHPTVETVGYFLFDLGRIDFKLRRSNIIIEYLGRMVLSSVGAI
jgi:hypothetical protein